MRRRRSLTSRRWRATILDRNGQILAISLPTAALFANPKEMIDPADVARKLKQVLPRLDEKQAAARLAAAKEFVYLERQITPAEEIAINGLGIPGVYFQSGEKRRYPLGRVAAQVLGGVDVDSHGVAGVERAFDQRLQNSGEPLRLSIDVRVQAVMRDELEKSKEEFQAIGACGIVMDVRTGEVIAMVSLPDYDANLFGETPPDDRFNRAVTGMFEPGSTFKLQTAAMALDFGTAHIWDQFDAAHNIRIGPLHDYRLQGQAPDAVFAGGAGLFVQPGRRTCRARRRRAAPAAVARRHGHVHQGRHRIAGSGPPAGAARQQLEGSRDDDRGFRPRHRGIAAARRARHCGPGQWRHRADTDHFGTRSNRRAAAGQADHEPLHIGHRS